MPASQPDTRVFIVEDHSVMRQLLSEVVERENCFVLCGTAASAEDALKAVPNSGAEMVLVDVSLPGMNGFEFVRRLREDMEIAPHCLMVSGHVEVDYARQALEAGACGYVLKGRPDDLRHALHRCMGGETFLSQPLAEKFDAVEEAD